MTGNTTLKVKTFLEEILRDYHRKSYLDSDPLGIVHEWSEPRDQEVVALLAAVLAYGKVAQIRASLRTALAVMKALEPAGPARLVARLGQGDSPLERELTARLDPYRHRFNRGVDVFLLLTLIARSGREYGSVGAHFLSPHLGTADLALEARWNAFIREWKEWVTERSEDRRTFGYFLTAPENGSSCKRWCMLLRWMIRRDEVDLGLWGPEGSLRAPDSVVVTGAQLFMPLDTHTGRISQFLGITRKKSLNWKATAEVTAYFREIDPSDPVKYDFALCRLGILELCQKTFNVEICTQCKLLPICQYANRKMKVRAKLRPKLSPGTKPRARRSATVSSAS